MDQPPPPQHHNNPPHMSPQPHRPGQHLTYSVVWELGVALGLATLK